MRFPRSVYACGWICLAALTAACLWAFLHTPFAERREVLRAQMDSSATGGDESAQTNVDYEALQNAIASKDTLWRPLVKPPAQEAPPPDLQTMLGPVVLSRQQIGTGDAMRVKVFLDPNDRRGRWISKGDDLNGLTVKEISPTEVVFSKEHKGSELTLAVPRSR